VYYSSIAGIIPYGISKYNIVDTSINIDEIQFSTVSWIVRIWRHIISCIILLPEIRVRLFVKEIK